MSKLANLKAAQVIRALRGLGWVERKTSTGKNPHVVMVKAGHAAHISVPVHKGKDVNPHLLGRVLKDAGVDIDEFLDAV